MKQKIADGTGMTKLEWFGWTSNILLRRIVDDAAISQFAVLKRGGITLNLANYRRRGEALSLNFIIIIIFLNHINLDPTAQYEKSKVQFIFLLVLRACMEYELGVIFAEPQNE